MMELGVLDILMFNFASNYFAQEYGVEVNPVWFIIAVITSSLLAIALPPLPGVGLMLYSTMFAQMGIPVEAIVLASLMGFTMSLSSQREGKP